MPRYRHRDEPPSTSFTRAELLHVYVQGEDTDAPAKVKVGDKVDTVCREAMLVCSSPVS